MRIAVLLVFALALVGCNGMLGPLGPILEAANTEVTVKVDGLTVKAGAGVDGVDFGFDVAGFTSTIGADTSESLCWIAGKIPFTDKIGPLNDLCADGD